MDELLQEVTYFKDMEEVEQVLRFLEDADIHLHLIALFMLSYGLNFSKTLEIEKREISIDGYYLKAERILFPYVHTCCLSARKYLESTPEDNNPYFFSRPGSRTEYLNRPYTSVKMTTALKRIGFKAAPSCFWKTFGFFYFQQHGTFLGSGFEHLLYRKEKACSYFGISEDAYNRIAFDALVTQRDFLPVQIQLERAKRLLSKAHSLLDSPDEELQTSALHFLKDYDALLFRYNAMLEQIPTNIPT